MWPLTLQIAFQVQKGGRLVTMTLIVVSVVVSVVVHV